MPSHQSNSKNNDLLLSLILFEGTETVSCRLSPVATDGTDGNGLKLEKIGQIFRVLMLRVPKILKKNYYG